MFCFLGFLTLIPGDDLSKDSPQNVLLEEFSTEESTDWQWLSNRSVLVFFWGVDRYGMVWIGGFVIDF